MLAECRRRKKAVESPFCVPKKYYSATAHKLGRARPPKNEAHINAFPCADVGFMEGLELEKGLRVVGDHPFFIGRNDQNIYSAVWGADAQIATGIGFRVEHNALPPCLLPVGAPQSGVVFADPSREHDGIETTGCRRKRAEFAHDAVAEKLNSFLGFGLVAGEQGSHILRNTGNAQQTGFFVQELGHFLDPELVVFHEEENQTGVDRTTASTHD